MITMVGCGKVGQVHYLAISSTASFGHPSFGLLINPISKTYYAVRKRLASDTRMGKKCVAFPISNFQSDYFIMLEMCPWRSLSGIHYLSHAGSENGKVLFAGFACAGGEGGGPRVNDDHADAHGCNGGTCWRRSVWF